MMRVIISEKAEQDLDAMDELLRGYFIKHMEKLENMPPRRHMRFGLPYFVEDVTRQARMIYHPEEDCIFILRCFPTHKEYERWYLSFR
jgi:hypothetical protein